MHAANNGVSWLGDISPDKMKFDVGRDAVAKAACEIGDNEASVFWCDSDIILPVDAITTLAHRAKTMNFGFLTGIYFQRTGDHNWPLIAHKTPKHGFQWLMKWPPKSVFPVDGCGFGCVLTSVQMLQDIGEMWFNYEEFSEDFDFCVKAKRKGYQLMVDSTVLCGHLADPVPVTIEDFHAKHPEFFGGQEREAS